MSVDLSQILPGEKIYKDPKEVEELWQKEKDSTIKDEKIDEKLKQAVTVYEEGKVIKGVIVAITEEGVFVDIGYKSEGVIPLSEFRDISKYKVGDEIDVYLEALEDEEGKVKISMLKARYILLWDDIERYYKEGTILKAKILKRIKGGMLVDLLGVDAFLPGSQIDIKPIPNMDEWVGKEIDVKIVKINKLRKNIVVSRRIILEEEREKMREQLLKELQVGQVREGIVKNVTDYGVFIDLGGADGLLHITDISWGRVKHPSQYFKVGDRIKVKILGFDEKKERISLGLKQLEPHPWERVGDKYKVGDVIEGTVVAVTDYGVFVELEPGIEGLIHVSEIPLAPDQKPRDVYKEGDKVKAKILSIDKKERKISLGLKQLGEDPWQNIEEKFPVGSKVKGKVCNITNFGVFVELPGGIDGLVHTSDLSWTKRYIDPSKMFKKGDEIEVVVLNIDKNERKISLGYKQTQENPWDKIIEKYPVGIKVEAEVVRVLPKSVIVDINNEFEAILPISEITKKKINKLSSIFNVGDKVPVKIKEYDIDNYKAIVSVIDYFDSDEEYEKWWKEVSKVK